MTEQKFLLPWLSAAAGITIVRLLHATGVDDITMQIQAAQNLLGGKRPGHLTGVPLGGSLPNLSRCMGMTHYSAGYQFFAAAMMAVGGSPGGVSEDLGI